ncbi:MAG TPA: heavy-metal-associated domain-containing protein [Desulfobacterales bacterium]|nr:heavy-metal-associated domain-containing protein [Desulfobacterales bacterium]
MAKQTLFIPNISCRHCIAAIKNELSKIEGVKKVEGDPPKKRIMVEWDLPATLEEIKITLKKINYPAE